MSQRLYAILSGKLDEIAALYKVRPRITLIVRMPGKPDECAFLSDDNWTDAVATVEYLSTDTKTFAAGPPEPKSDPNAGLIDRFGECLVCGTRVPARAGKERA